MPQWVPNVVALFLGSAVVGLWGLALLWRVGSWHIPQAATLTNDEGLKMGSRAPEIACYAPDGTDRHVSFGGRPTMLVFGKRDCIHCPPLLEAARSHPATSYMRLVYLTDDAAADLDPEIEARWEVYAFENEKAARQQWRAPVSPYFHILDPVGRVIQKGVASKSPHLDRLLSLRPGVVARNVSSNGA